MTLWWRAPALAHAARRVALAAVATSAACARPPSPGAATPENPPPNVAAGRLVRVSLGTVTSAAVTASGAWQATDADGRVVARGGDGDHVSFSPAGPATVRLSAPDGAERDVSAPVVISSGGASPLISVNGQRYRGELSIIARESALQVVNRVAIETYLRGVVPRELGVRGPSDRAALEAQAVAARSYAITRLGNTSRPYDLTATTTDQVYGGVSAEDPLANAAIDATAGLVLTFNGRVVSAPYHSTCGGSTAAPEELWRSANEPFLQRVSDRVPGTDRFYCDIAPRFRWERSWRADTLTAVVERYLRAYAQVAAGGPGAVRGVSVDGRTPSGRVAALWIETDRGRYRVRGNDIRYVLRAPGGELLNSTYFSPEVVSSPDGRLTRLTIRGQGYGHGVGMCQWGAIGRSRAGQDFRTILRTYFPGTTVARAY
jgi:stage II sporulation protein D